MAKKICELCKNEDAQGTLFGVNICDNCRESFSKAMAKDMLEIERFLNPKTFPNATELAKKNIIHRVSSAKATVEKVIVNTEKQIADSQKEEFARSADVNYNDVMGKDADDSLDGWYADIGCKIKGWAKWIFIIEAIFAVLFGIVTMAAGGNDFSIIIGIMILVIGPIIAWISSWLLYGFGELIDKTCATEQHTKDILKVMLEINKK